MEFLFQKTGSSGNATVLSDGKTMIQIDAGVQLKKVNEGIGYKLTNIQGLLCTHHHLDHVEYLKDFLKFGMKCFALKETAEQVQISSFKRNLKTFEFLDQLQIGSFTVKPFPVQHTNVDGTDCPNAGFLIYSNETKEKLIWITDAAYIENKFPPVEYICIECNYIDVEDYSKELEYINAYVEKRRFKSHLSLSLCIDFLKKQDLSKVKEIRLLHLTKQQGEIKDVILKEVQKQFPDIKILI